MSAPRKAGGPRQKKKKEKKKKQYVHTFLMISAAAAAAAAAPEPPVISIVNIFSPRSLSAAQRAAERVRFPPTPARSLDLGAEHGASQAQASQAPQALASQALASQALASQALASQASHALPVQPQAPHIPAALSSAAGDSKFLPVVRPPPSYDGYYALYPLDRAHIENTLPVLPIAVITDYLKTLYNSGGGAQNIVNKGLRVAHEVLLLQPTPPEFIARLPARPSPDNTGEVSLYAENTGYRNNGVYSVEVTLSFRTLGAMAADVPPSAAHPTFDAITKAACSCIIGLSGSCWHIFHLLLCAHDLPRGADSPVPVSSTSVLMRWNNPSCSASDAVANLKAVRAACLPLWSATRTRVGSSPSRASPSWVSQRNSSAQPDVAGVGARAAAVVLAPVPTDDPSWVLAGRGLFDDMIRAASRSVLPPKMPAAVHWGMSAGETRRVAEWFDADRLRVARGKARRVGAAPAANTRADAGAAAEGPPWPARFLYVGSKRRLGDSAAAAPPDAPPVAPPAQAGAEGAASAPALSQLPRPFFVKHATKAMLKHGHKYTQSSIAALPPAVASSSFVLNFDPRIPFFCKFCHHGFYQSVNHFNCDFKCIRWEVTMTSGATLLQRWQDAQPSPRIIPGENQSYRDLNPR